MEQLILHLLGDYLIQNDFMAQNKKQLTRKGEIACQIHSLTYSLPFLLIGSLPAVILIYLSHYLIDRSGFVKWYMRTTGKEDFTKQPFSPWSIFIIDNTFHLICNYFALTYL